MAAAHLHYQELDTAVVGRVVVVVVDTSSVVSVVVGGVVGIV